MAGRLGPYLLGPSETFEGGIYCGDALELTKAVPSESIDLIFTDPVYNSMEQYRWLAKTAMRILKSDGALLVWYNTKLKVEILNILCDSGLHYRWDLAVMLTGSSGCGLSDLVCKMSNCVWLDNNETSRTRYRVWDVHFGVSLAGLKLVNPHRWAKDLSAIERWVGAFSSEGDIVFDPFCGCGTVPVACKKLKRRYLAFELEAGVCEFARLRVANAQPPLRLFEFEQIEMKEKGAI